MIMFSSLTKKLVSLGFDLYSIRRWLAERKARPEGNPLPASAHIEVSGKCQLQCSYCSKELRASNRTKMTLTEFKHILDNLPGLKGATLTIMNEPLLNDELPQLIAETKARNMTVNFPTNGVYFPSHLQKSLLRCGLDSISFSIDSMDPSYFNSLRPPAKLEKVLQNIESMVRTRNNLQSPCRVVITTVVNDHLLEDLDSFITKSLDIGIDKIILRFPHCWSPGDKKDEQLLIRSKTDVLASLRRARKNHGDSVSFFDYPSLATRVRCLRPFTTTAIKVDGQVVPCCLQASDPKQTTLGNIYSESFKSIWDNEPYKNFRRQFLKGSWPEICEGCTVLMGLSI